MLFFFFKEKIKINKCVSPSIFCSQFLLHSGWWEPAGASPSCNEDSLEFLIYLTYTFLDCGWKPENPERTQNLLAVRRQRQSNHCNKKKF